MPVARRGAGWGVDGDKMYVFGGETDGNKALDGDVYDPTTDMWTSFKSNFSTGVTKCDFSVVNSGRSGWDTFYGFAGRDLCTTTATDTIWKLRGETWELVNTTLTYPRYGIHPVAVGSTVYIYGGRHMDTIRNDWETFDIPTERVQTWVTTRDTIPELWLYSAVAVQSRIFIFGGAIGINEFTGEALTRVFRVDTTTNVAREMTSMSKRRISPAIAAVGTTIFVVGGLNGGTKSGPASWENDLEVYDTVGDVWSLVDVKSHLVVPRYDAISAVVRGRWLVTGGDSSKPGTVQSTEYLDLGSTRITKYFWSFESTLEGPGEAFDGWTESDHNIAINYWDTRRSPFHTAAHGTQGMFPRITIQSAGWHDSGITESPTFVLTDAGPELEISFSLLGSGCLPELYNCGQPQNALGTQPFGHPARPQGYLGVFLKRMDTGERVLFATRSSYNTTVWESFTWTREQLRFFVGYPLRIMAVDTFSPNHGDVDIEASWMGIDAVSVKGVYMDNYLKASFDDPMVDYGWRGMGWRPSDDYPPQTGPGALLPVDMNQTFYTNETQVFQMNSFVLGAHNPWISFYMLGGKCRGLDFCPPEDVLGTRDLGCPITGCENTGVMGVALVRLDTNERVLFAQRSGIASRDTWEYKLWSRPDLAPYLGIPLTIQIIDSYYNTTDYLEWVGIDELTIQTGRRDPCPCPLSSNCTDDLYGQRDWQGVGVDTGTYETPIFSGSAGFTFYSRFQVNTTDQQDSNVMTLFSKAQAGGDTSGQGGLVIGFDKGHFLIKGEKNEFHPVTERLHPWSRDAVVVAYEWNQVSIKYTPGDRQPWRVQVNDQAWVSSGPPDFETELPIHPVYVGEASTSMTAANTVWQGLLREVELQCAGPQLKELVPPLDEDGISSFDVLEMHFHEQIFKGTGFLHVRAFVPVGLDAGNLISYQNISIHDTSIEVQGNILRYTPPANLTAGALYRIAVDPGAVRLASGRGVFVGIGVDEWNFKTSLVTERGSCHASSCAVCDACEFVTLRHNGDREYFCRISTSSGVREVQRINIELDPTATCP